MENCGMSCIKYLLFVFNFLFALSGVGIIAAGAVFLSEVDDYSHFLENATLAPPIILIVAGIIVFLIAFLGCCGAIKENYKMLIAFAVMLVIVFIVELAVGIAAAVNKDTFKQELKTVFQNSMKNYQNERKAWEVLQRKLECCGIDGPNDWQFSGGLPASCCHPTPNSGNEADSFCQRFGNENVVYQEGCFEKLSMRIKEGSVVMMGVGIGIAFIELAGVVLALFLACAIKKEDQEGKE